MRVEQWWRAARAMALAALVITCKSSEDPSADSIDAPADLTAEGVGMRTVRLSWRVSHGADVAGYQIERRENLQGDFKTIEESVLPPGADRVSYFDISAEPDTYYGYRVRAVNRFGAHSGMTNVAGAKTASAPGISIQTSTSPPGAAFLDPDGYTAQIRGPHDTSSTSLAVSGLRFIPKDRGTYTVVLRGLANNCAMQTAADSMKTATVNDEGVETVALLAFTVSCQDPTKGSIVVAYSTTGDTLDADGLAIGVSGISKDASVPANERVYYQTRTTTGRSGATRFDNLWPGDYEVSVSDIDPPCTLDGDRIVRLVPKPLKVDTVKFAVTCRKPELPPDTVGKPFILRHTWSSSTARPGDKVFLLTSIDVRALATQQVAGVSAEVQLDNQVVRYDSSRSVRSFDITTVSQPLPGVIDIVAANADASGRAGNVDIVRTWYTVVGTNGSAVRTSTELRDVFEPPLVQIKDKVHAVEATLTVSNTAPPPNQSPTARITGPTSGSVGAALTFSGSTSSDPDGTIASYAWNFGDSSTGTGASASHTYSAAGTYTVRLTVTDDKGATNSAESSVAITAAGPTTGTVTGTVTSPQRGPLAGVTVTVDGGGGTATTNASGAYTISNVAVGSKTLTLSNVPSGCTAPASQTATVTAGGSATANFTVTCSGTATTGTVTGKVTRASDNSGIGDVQVLVTAAGATSPITVTTSSDGTYTAANVAIGSGANAGTGTITLQQLPSVCTNPGSKTYTGLTAGGTVTSNISVTCTGTNPQTGTVKGKLTKSTGGNVAGVQVKLTPTGASAPLGSVTTDANGDYTVANVPVGPGGTIAIEGSLPSGCTAPTGQTYGAVAAGATVTKDITLTCTAGAVTYPVTATWGPITNTGPTGRQVTLSLAIDMGTAPGRPDINGAHSDSLAGISFDVAFNGTFLDYLSRTLLSPDDYDLVVVGPVNRGLATAHCAVAIGNTTGGAPRSGAIQLVRLTFNIASGKSGSVALTVTPTEAVATLDLINVTANVVVQPLPPLTIP
jgi:hypothetical protein